MPIVGRRGDATGARSRHARRDPPRRRKQEMARTAGRIEHRDRQQLCCWILGLRFDAVQHRIERLVEQRLHKAIGSVIATAGLTGVALGFTAFGKSEPMAFVGQSAA